jgi:DNA-binding transcriptional LysR family regulator
MSSAPAQRPLTPSGAPDHLIRHATLRQLQLFEAIVRLSSFTRAAEELFLTQPTVSMQIKKLGEAVGTPLLEQIGRRIQPTQAGQETYRAAQDILHALADLEVRLADLKGLRRGRLRLAVVTTAKYFVPEILGDFCERYPGIDVSLKVTNRDRVLERLANCDDDLYILGQTGEDLDVEVVPFAPNPLVVIARSDHPLLGEERIPLARLAREQFILREPGSGIRDLVLRLFAEQGLRPSVRMELGSNEAIKHAVLGGLGISALSLHSLTLDASSGRLGLLDVEGFPHQRRWYMVYPRGRGLSLVAKAFLDFATESGPAISKLLDETLLALSRPRAH